MQETKQPLSLKAPQKDEWGLDGLTQSRRFLSAPSSERYADVSICVGEFLSYLSAEVKLQPQTRKTAFFYLVCKDEWTWLFSNENISEEMSKRCQFDLVLKLKTWITEANRADRRQPAYSLQWKVYDFSSKTHHFANVAILKQKLMKWKIWNL